MSHDGGTVPLAAGGVVAEFINGLHAKRARNLIGDNGGAESIRSSDSEDLRFHDGVSSIEEGRDGSDPRTCVRLRDPFEAFSLPAGLSARNKASVDLLVDLVRRGLLRTCWGRQNDSRNRPGFARLGHRFQEAG